MSGFKEKGKLKTMLKCLPAKFDSANCMHKSNSRCVAHDVELVSAIDSMAYDDADVVDEHVNEYGGELASIQYYHCYLSH